MNIRPLAWCGSASAALLLAFACSNKSETEHPGTTPEAMPFSEWSMGCESQPGGSQQQQQQISYKHPEQQSCSKQSVQFPKTGISGFHFDVDCDSQKVNVTQLGSGSGASGRALRTESFPMQTDDSFKGQMSYQQKLPHDGKGNVSCWVEYVVIFDGKCGCERKEDGSWTKSVDVQSTVTLQQSDPSILGGGSPSPQPSVSPSPSPSPSPEPSESPSPSLSPSPSPRPSGSPRPTPTIVPVVVCVVDNNACPWVGDGHMKCD